MNTSGFKIFGQEPAAVTGVIEALLALLLSFGLFNLTQDTVGVIMAVVTAAMGLLVAYATHQTVYSAVIGLAKSVLVLAVTFGLHVTDNQTASLIAVVTLVAGLYLRQQVDSTDTAVSNASDGTKKRDLELLALAA
jgi:hypothetical protein